MDFKRIWMGYASNPEMANHSGSITAICGPVDNDDTAKADKEIESLLKLGWRIASTCPVTATTNILNRKEGVDVYLTYTKGIEIFMVKG